MILGFAVEAEIIPQILFLRAGQCDALADGRNFERLAGKCPPVKPQPAEIRRVQ